MTTQRKTWLAFVAVVIVGGSNAVAVRFSNLELPPFWGAGLRFGAAAVILWAIVLGRRMPLPRGRALFGALIFGALAIGLAYALLYWALLSVTASLTMVVLAIGPLLTFFLAWAHGQEPFRWRGLVGALVAFAGILVIVGNQIGASIPLLPLLALFAAALMQSESAVLYKFFPQSHPLVVNALALSIGTAILLLASVIAGETPGLPAARATWVALVYLILAGSVLLFYLVLYVLQHWTASATSYIFLLFPVATIVIASWLADEVVTPGFLAGAAIIIFGVWLGAIARPARLKARPAVS
ncbi:MAG: DMT family transporter [Candidatus Promineifilaceae bacterium]